MYLKKNTIIVRSAQKMLASTNVPRVVLIETQQMVALLRDQSATVE